MANIRGGDKVMARLQEIAQGMGGGSVKVGFMAGALYPDGTPVASVAFWNEFGTATSPPRPFFRQMVADKSPNWPRRMAALAKSTDFDGPKVLGLMGESAAGSLQESINLFSTPKLAPSTVARKGFDKPLIDTADMLRAVTYKVES
jgi:hypothetical protein